MTRPAHHFVDTGMEERPLMLDEGPLSPVLVRDDPVVDPVQERADMIGHRNGGSIGWLSDSIRMGEVQGSDLRRMSTSPDVVLGPETVSRPADSLGRAAAYASLMVYEICAFDLIPAQEDTSNRKSGFFSLFSCASRSKTDDNMESVLEGRAKTRNLVCRLGISDQGMSDQGTSPHSVVQFMDGKKRSNRYQKTHIAKNTLSPVWRAIGYTGAASARKRPTEALMEYQFGLAHILQEYIHVEIIDTDTDDCIAVAKVELRKLFDNAFGAATTPLYRALVLPDKYRQKLAAVHDNLDEYICIATGGGASSVLMNQETDVKSNAEESHELPAGRIRMRFGVISEDYILDLLRYPDEEILFSALQMFLRIVQMADPQTVFSSIHEPSSPRSRFLSGKAQSDAVHPLRILVQEENLQYLFSTIDIAAQDETLKKDVTKRIESQLRIARAIADILQAGASKFGPLFTTKLESFGPILAQFTNMEEYTEDIALSFVDIILTIPTRSLIEAISWNTFGMLRSLLSILDAEALEESQVVALQALNKILHCVKGMSTWRSKIVAFMYENGIRSYLEENFECWHPQIAEETIRLYNKLYQASPFPLSESTIGILTSIVEESGNGRQKAQIQLVLFSLLFQLRVLNHTVVNCNVSSSLIYPVSNVTHYRSHGFRSPEGSYNNIVITTHLEAKTELTHVALCAKQGTSRALCGAMVLLSNSLPSKSILSTFASMKLCELEQIHVIESIDGLEYHGFIQCDQDYSELVLPRPVQAAYLTLVCNPGDCFRSPTYITMDYVLPIGRDAGKSKELADYKSLVRPVGSYIGVPIPEKEVQVDEDTKTPEGIVG